LAVVVLVFDVTRKAEPIISKLKTIAAIILVIDLLFCIFIHRNFPFSPYFSQTKQSYMSRRVLKLCSEGPRPKTTRIWYLNQNSD
jgi:hypothetical protein